jgi:hypothetical protein
VLSVVAGAGQHQPRLTWRQQASRLSVSASRHQRLGWLRKINLQMFIPPVIPPVTFCHFLDYTNAGQGKP